MRVTQEDVARVPTSNLRVPRAKFGVLWAAAELRRQKQGEHGILDRYVAGVAVTCEWLAGAMIEPAAGAP